MAAYRILGNPFFIERLLKKRCRILPAGGLGVSPSFRNPPRLGDIGGSLRLLQQSQTIGKAEVS